MQRVKVNSSNIDSIGYITESSILEVKFLNGSIYHYYGVGVGVFNSLMNAGSHGKFLNAYIKGRYRYKRV